LVKIAVLRYNGLTRISEGMNMDAQPRDEMNTDDYRCPKCGFEETGYFCRNCGGLVHGDDLVLCPRCRQVVPGAEYCNQCGQVLGDLALTLQQLALAGDAFWATGETGLPPSSPEPSLLAPDESVDLAPAELPDWLQELPAELAPPEVQQHIYPALRPIEAERAASQQRPFLIVVILLAGLLLLSVVFMALYVLLAGGA
jgi:DNA-directed RNA polymerase subunit RPC12/RpoP